MKEEDIEILERIAEYESNIDWSVPGMNLGWEWRDVRVMPAVLNRLFAEGYLDSPYKSNSMTGYRLSEKGKQAITGIEKMQEESEPEEVKLPRDMFGDIIGHDDVKELIIASIIADKPVHVLLAGPPALAKTLFLWEVERVLGENAVWLVGSATSKAGLWDIVAVEQPRVLLIDELDKMGIADTAALLSIMEGGRLVRAKKGRELKINHQVWVLAATNRLNKLSPELLSRFAIKRIYAYSRVDYQSVVKGVLIRREGTSTEMAEEIASKLDGLTQDVRDAVRVARLATNIGVDDAIRLLFDVVGSRV